jgi:hypothetical protein
MKTIDKMIEINNRGHLTQLLEAYKIIKRHVYKGDKNKTYSSFKSKD